MTASEYGRVADVCRDIQESISRASEKDGQSLLRRELLLLDLIEQLHMHVDKSSETSLQSRVSGAFHQLSEVRRLISEADIQVFPGETDPIEFAGDLPVNGGVYQILNPFVDTGTPSPRLTTEGMASAGRIGAQPKFTNRTDSAVNWKFEFVQALPNSGPFQTALYRVRAPGLPDNPDPSGYAIRGPYLVRDRFAKFDAASNPDSIWQLVTLDGGVTFFADPNSQKVMFAKFLGNAYWPLVGTPSDPTSRELRVLRVS